LFEIVPHDIESLLDWTMQKDALLRPQSPHQILDHFDRSTKIGARNRPASDGRLLNANDRRSTFVAVFGLFR
jgi:hypothetical protein